MRTRSLFRLSTALLLALPALTAAQTRTAAPQGASVTQPAERRDDWQRPADIFAALGATAGSRIADLGAGEGWLTLRLAKQVGRDGRVFASDLDLMALRRLAETIAKDTLRNVEIVLAEDDDPRLPLESLDGVVIVNAYHEMTKRVAVLDGVKRALAPGGKLVIGDNTPADTLRTRKEQTDRHTLGIDFARDDLEAQGFEIVSLLPMFVEQKHADHSHKQWMIVARLVAK